MRQYFPSLPRRGLGRLSGHGEGGRLGLRGFDPLWSPLLRGTVFGVSIDKGIGYGKL